MGVATEYSGLSFPRNLSVWWSEETEYVLQRIERWAAYARGYNRLRSVRLSPGRLTMQDEPADSNRWSISPATNRLVVENSWAPSFQRHHRRQHAGRQAASAAAAAERSRLSCCAFTGCDYKSNGNLDSNCLEAYSLDHSIYFKTVGEIRRQKPAETRPEASQQQQPRMPLDCGDFLSSDFEDMMMEGEEEEDGEESVDPEALLRDSIEALELREQLSQLGAARDEMGNAPAVIQVCRSAINEDEINNNFTAIGLPRQFVRPAAAGCARVH